MTLEVQRSKKNTPKLMYNKILGAKTGVCLRLLEHSDMKDGIKECIKGNAWFRYARAAASLGKKGYKSFLQVKGNKGLYSKAFIEEAMAGTPGGTKIVLKGQHPNGMDLIAVGYHYSTKTMLYFVMTADAGALVLLVSCLLYCILLYSQLTVHCCVLSIRGHQEWHALHDLVDGHSWQCPRI
jgi:hypothetical protein